MMNLLKLLIPTGNYPRLALSLVQPWFNGNFPFPLSVERFSVSLLVVGPITMGIPSLVRKMKGKSPKKSGVYQQSLHPQDFKKSATYINVTIRDASEVVYGKVHSALRRINLAPKILPKIKGKVADKIATEASRRVPPSQVATVLATRLPKLLMYQMYHKHGMTISAQTVFVENEFIVVQLQVLRVDAKRLLGTTSAKATNSNAEGGEGGGHGHGRHESCECMDRRTATTITGCCS